MTKLIVRSHARMIFASTLGYTIEFYEFSVFATMAALIFRGLFFPATQIGAGMLLTFGSFAVGFLSRPLGGIVFGYLGDRIGRKPVMVWSLWVMGVATVLIGLLPTYAAIGIAAPLLLTLLRFLQGFGIGGEWGGAVTLVVEHASVRRKGFYGSLVQTGSGFGTVLSSLTIALLLGTLSRTQMAAWGWRIPFLLSAVLLAIGLWARGSLTESPAFETLRDRGELPEAPLVETLRDHGLRLLLSIGIYTSLAAFGFLMVFIVSYAIDVLGFSQIVVVNAMLAGSVAYLMAIPIGGLLSDRFGLYRSFMVCGITRIPLCFVFFALLDTRSVMLLVAGLLLAGAMNGLLYGMQAALFVKLFPVRIRYTGISLGFQTASVFGGLTPVAATLLLGAGGGKSWCISLLMSGLCALTVLCLFMASCFVNRMDTYGAKAGSVPPVRCRRH